MNFSQLVVVGVVSLLVVTIAFVVISYEIKARQKRIAYEKVAEISQELAILVSDDPIVGSWAYTDVTLGGMKAFEVDHTFTLTGDSYGQIQLIPIGDGLYNGVLRAGDPPTVISVAGDVATVGSTKYDRIKK
jgi:hypothetical protein